ncbi:MAG: tetratricopeptide repeat protein, partial [Cyanobacteriota bacterium]|nr:tetratricopeptide repeat protein [Cyanobacteriota bacterium]
ALVNLNLIYTRQGDSQKEIENHLRRLEIAKKQDNKWQRYTLLMGLGSVYDSIGKHQKALEVYQKSLALSRQIEISKLTPHQQKNLPQYQVLILQLRSQNYRRLGEYNKALDFAQQMLKKAESFNNPKLQVQALLNLASIYDIPFNNLSKAIELSQKALSVAQKNQLLQEEAEVLIDLSGFYNKQRQYDTALEFAQKALVIAKKLNNPKLEYNALAILRNIYKKQGEYQKAVEYAQKVYALVQKENLGIYKITTLTSLSEIYLNLGDTVKAEEIAKQAINIAKENRNYDGEGLGLIYLTKAYQFQGKYEEGIETAQKFLQISRQNKYFIGEVAASLSLSEIYERLGNYQKVIAVAQPNIIQARKINQRDKEAQLLINLGNAYRVIGEYTKSKELIEQGLKIAQELKNPRLESIALNSLGYYYRSIKDYQKALELTQQGLNIAQKLESPPLLISPQFNLGDIYSNLGDYQKSRDYYQKALATSQKLKNRRGEGIALLTLASNYFSQSKPQKTVELSQQALTIFQEIKVPKLQASAHLMLSLGYGELGNDTNAMQSAQKFLEFSRKVENPVFEKDALNFLGMIHYRFGRNQEAIKSYQQAIAIQTPENVTGSEWGLYAGLGRVYRKLNQPKKAIENYELAINAIQEIRGGIEGLPPELQKSFLDTVIDFQGTKTADIYRELAELFISQGRQAEAQQVLDLLKIQEIRDFAEGTKNESIIALSKQISACEKTNCKEIDQLNARFTALRDRFDQDLDKIETEIRDRIANDPNTFRPNSPKAADIVTAQPGTVMIYPLVMEDKLWLLLYSGDVAKTFKVEVSRDNLGNTVKEFRRLMEECERKHCGAGDIQKIQAVSQKLYGWLIKPLEGELKQNQIKNLVFALDQVTRYVPMSALYDGKQYLIENYTIYNVLSADLTNTKDRLPQNMEETKVLAMGVSEAVGGFSALPNVPTEVNRIVRTNVKDEGIYPGQEHLNQSFNFKTLRDNIAGKNILHLATHGKFVPDRKKASYLLLGNGDKLPIPQIQTLPGLRNLHLVVLSACQTALGGPRQDGVEIASLAYSFLNR